MKISIPAKITPRQAVKLQKKLAPLVQESSELPPRISSLLGCDATYDSGVTLATATEVTYNDLSLVKTTSAKETTTFPYVPGLLAFREAPSVLRAIRRLRAKDYVCLVDAHGVAHPRRFGLACFIGLALNRPTIGVAKSLLYGRLNGRRVVDRDGYALAELVTTPRGKTIYVSVGHKISLEDAVRIVKHSMGPSGPIPIRLAHVEVTKQRWQIKKSSQVS